MIGLYLLTTNQLAKDETMGVEKVLLFKDMI
jgi:hypothetical protein